MMTGSMGTGAADIVGCVALSKPTSRREAFGPADPDVAAVSTLGEPRRQIPLKSSAALDDYWDGSN
jgi:hypothetical protein